jgi:hypothetical protein
MAYSTDADLTEYQPDILTLGIDSFTEEHDKAQADIIRELRAKWYSKKNTDKELDATLLTDSQFKVASVYLVLWKYALPQLTNWVDGDRFLEMIKFYKSRYGEEMADILASGVEYDADGDGVVTKSEKVSIGAGRLTR